MGFWNNPSRGHKHFKPGFAKEFRDVKIVSNLLRYFIKRFLHPAANMNHMQFSQVS